MPNNISWQQVAVFVASLAAVIAAHKLLGEDAAGVALVATTAVNFLLGRPADGGGK